MSKTLAVAVLAVACAGMPLAATAPSPGVRERALAIAAAIRRADYAGDRAALSRLHDEMRALRTDDARLASRLRYWQAFALWRRALNGFSDSASPADLQQDLERALAGFEESYRLDAAFVDARIGQISCQGNLLFLYRADQEKVKAMVPAMVAMTKAALAAAPQNPRLQWVLGPQLWWTPVERGGGQAAAAAAYEKGLALARKPSAPADGLEPSWGEAELLMNLAWTRLNQSTPDVAAAEAHAREALRLVPHWRYLRDVLLPQIHAAKGR